jgi:hypothetical protein
VKCTYVCLHTHTNTHTHKHKHTHIHTHTHIRLIVGLWLILDRGRLCTRCVCTHTHIHTHTNTHTHTHTHRLHLAPTHTHTHTHTHTQVQDEAGNDGIVELHADGKSMQPTIRERLDNKCLYVSIQTTFQLAYYCVPVLSLTPPLLPWASFQERDLTSPTSSPRSSPPMGTQTRMCAARARVSLLHAMRRRRVWTTSNQFVKRQVSLAGWTVCFFVLCT